MHGYVLEEFREAIDVTSGDCRIAPGAYRHYIPGLAHYRVNGSEVPKDVFMRLLNSLEETYVYGGAGASDL